MGATDNTMIWVLGGAAAIALVWLWRGGAARGKAGTQGHGGPAVSRLYSNPRIIHHRSPDHQDERALTRGWTHASLGGPWPNNTPQGRL